MADDRFRAAGFCRVGVAGVGVIIFVLAIGWATAGGDGALASPLVETFGRSHFVIGLIRATFWSALAAGLILSLLGVFYGLARRLMR